MLVWGSVEARVIPERRLGPVYYKGHLGAIRAAWGVTVSYEEGSPSWDKGFAGLAKV